MAVVKIYSTPNCPYCKLTKQFLTENNIPYEDIDVSVNQLAAQEMISRSGQMGVPVIEIDGILTVGFDEAGLKKQLGL